MLGQKIADHLLGAVGRTGIDDEDVVDQRQHAFEAARMTLVSFLTIMHSPIVLGVGPAVARASAIVSSTKASASPVSCDRSP